MKRIDLAAYGVPEQVVRCVDVPDPGPPDAGEVVFDVVAFPINPADIAFCTGSYRLRPPLPATPGAECLGRVVATGAGVTHVKPGDHVINLQRENWVQRRRVRGDDVIAIPPAIPPRQAAMLRINPPTAQLLLSDVTPMHPGDWLIQNVANSAVGRLVIRLAKAQGLHTINVVRRDSLFAELQALGADHCIVDGPNLAERVAALAAAPIRLGIDAVCGPALARIASCVADGGAVVTYGAMSGGQPAIDRGDLMFRGLTLSGFMLGRFLGRRSLDEIRAIFADLGQQMLAGKLDAPVAAVYPIEQIAEAVAHAQREAKGGKILVAPNGMI
ncbi:MAG: 2-enoyl thioester reductase domain-containing protein [Acetobacteraceae bacterium]|nr:2-enoyl thioester reductase domain-containing protein [Acetobacteraceae bacterium]